MRKLSFFFAFLMVLTFGMGAFAQDCGVTIGTPTGTWDDAGTIKLMPNATHTVAVHFMNEGCGWSDNFNVANSFYLSSADADWMYFKAIVDAPGADINRRNPNNSYTYKWASMFITHFTFNGTLPYVKTADSTNEPDEGIGIRVWTVAAPGAQGGANLRSVASIAASTQSSTGGFHVPYDSDVYFLEFSNNGNTAVAGPQGTICLDTCNPSSGGTWQWSYVTVHNVTPSWYPQPQCWTIEKPPHLCPTIAGLPANATFSHCATASLNFAVTVVDGENQGLPLVVTSNIGTVTPGSVDGLVHNYTWSYNGATTGFQTLTITYGDQLGCSETADVNLEFTNAGPVITCPGDVVTIQTGATKTQQVTATDDCDALTFALANANGAAGVIDVNPTTGLVTYTPDPADVGARSMTISVTDGLVTVQCDINWNVLDKAPYGVVIEKVHDQIQGQYTDVDITLTGIQAEEGFGGFDLLIAYDNSALSFQQAVEGAIYAECGWEFFTYRFGPDGNCGSGCPSGITRVIGIAETNNGAHHPTCVDPMYVGGMPVTLASLRFLVSNDRNLECQYVPVRFFWLDCGDNTLSNASGSHLFLNQKVYDYAGDVSDPYVEISDPTFGFPGYLGAPNYCLEQAIEEKAPIRNVDFYNGGVDIICADSIDDRGDINLNGIPYEVADAVMFTNYFISGFAAFEHVQGSIAASDVNADGVPLTVADLVYLIRVIIGDANPYPKLNPTYASYALENGVMSVSAEMGAAFVVFEGKVEPKLLATNMDMKVGMVNGNTQVLVYSTTANQVFADNFLAVDGNVVSVEFATYEGQPVAAKNVPRTFHVEQNYPNPFNPTTTIEFGMPTSGAYAVDIYNVAGQHVQSLTGVADAGIVKVTWDASNLASGVYFYRVAAGDQVETRKAMLLK